jgi:hypothetical protein
MFIPLWIDFHYSRLEMGYQFKILDEAERKDGCGLMLCWSAIESAIY